jgi:hypothetical protein
VVRALFKRRYWSASAESMLNATREYFDQTVGRRMEGN